MVIYESTRGRTKAMAEAICKGIQSENAECDLVSADEYKGLGEACAVAVGASTRMKRPLPKVRQILGELPTLDGRPVAAFGSYGWSGEAPGFIGSQLEALGGKLVAEPLRAKDYPDEQALEACSALGKMLVDGCRQK